MRHNILKFILIVAIVAAAGAIIMLLWNSIIPSVVGWNSLNYFQAIGLLILCRLLFGGFSGLRGAKEKFHHRHTMHQDMRNRVKGMSKREKMEYIKEYMTRNSRDEK